MSKYLVPLFDWTHDGSKLTAAGSVAMGYASPYLLCSVEPTTESV